MNQWIDYDVELNEMEIRWWELYDGYRLRKWRGEIRRILSTQGMDIKEVCSYMGVRSTEYPCFIKKLPGLRKTYIGIGMALGQSLETINRWITKYGRKRKLYAKDVFEDLVWIYLIQMSTKNREKNYYQMYDACREEIERAYREVWEASSDENIDTAVLEKGLLMAGFDEEYVSLKMFVRDHMQAFGSAYRKPRRYLQRYVEEILRVLNEHMMDGHRWSLNSLRAWLDDSMINYLSGSYDVIYAMDREGNATASFKHMPNSKKSHMELCMALGMTLDDMNEYLGLMGYSSLDVTFLEEAKLINQVTRWGKEHPAQARFKERYLHGNRQISLTKEEEREAVDEMLSMREDIRLGMEGKNGE